MKKELQNVRKIRATQRKKRESVPVPVVSIVGYTNAGKSTLISALTDSDVFVEDKLFATLDPSVRKYCLKNGLDIILIDTVGFIRKIPHLLVEAFNATLEEITRSDLILSIIDGSEDELFNHLQATENVLRELKTETVPRINVVNKSDLLVDDDRKNIIRKKLPDAVFISAKEKTNFAELGDRMTEFFDSKMVPLDLKIPYCDFNIYNSLLNCGSIKQESSYEKGLIVKADVFYRYVSRFEEYFCEPSEIEELERK